MWSATIQDSSALDRKPLLGELVRDVVRQIGPARAAIGVGAAVRELKARAARLFPIASCPITRRKRARRR